MTAEATPSRRDRWAPHVGLCSVTLRRHPVDDVLVIAQDAGLRCVEWGADVHAPPHDHVRLPDVRMRTERAGLRVASYGSYWRAGVSTAAELDSLAVAATALGAPRVRLWAGPTGSDAADGRAREVVAQSLRGPARSLASTGWSWCSSSTPTR